MASCTPWCLLRPGGRGGGGADGVDEGRGGAAAAGPRSELPRRQDSRRPAPRRSGCSAASGARSPRSSAPPQTFDVVALNAATGAVLWTYSYLPSTDAKPCCGRVNRGLAILGNTLYMGTTDAHLIAIDAKTGMLLWDTAVAVAKEGYAITHAPLIVKDKVIVGTAGGEYGIRGFVAAYNAGTGKEVWRFHNVPEPGEPGNNTWAGDSWKHGGASVWTTGSYDPDLNLTYWGTGNAGPDFDGDARAGDNLYCNSVLALDADTGKLKWHYQFSPHDERDWDAAQIPLLADIQWPDANGQAAAQGHDVGQSQRRVLRARSHHGKIPAGQGLHHHQLAGRLRRERPPDLGRWQTASARRRTGDCCIRASRAAQAGIRPPSARAPDCSTFPLGTTIIRPSASPRSRRPSLKAEFWRRRRRRRSTSRGTAAMSRSARKARASARCALSIRKTGEKKWEYKMTDITMAGILTTATDVLFSGAHDGRFFALDARTGAELWKTQLAGAVYSGAMSYSVNGKQYVAVSGGNTLYVFALK